MGENEIIFFTKAPKLGYAKSRFSKYFIQEDCLKLAKNLIRENKKIIDESGFPSIIHFSGDRDDIDFVKGEKRLQVGEGLGERMFSSLKMELKNFKKVLLQGSDLAFVKPSLYAKIFKDLDKADIVLIPTEDGGYGMVAMKEPHDIFSGIKYSTSKVLEDTIKKIEAMGLTYILEDTIIDVDDLDSLMIAETGDRSASFIGMGEYNINYLAEDKVYRLNLGSQMNLGRKQIFYEYQALEELRSSGVTPKPCFVKDEGKFIPTPFLTMEYLEGRPLNYDKDLDKAAYILGRIHSINTEDSKLLKAEKPFLDMFTECSNMFALYKDWPKKDPETLKIMNMLFELAQGFDLNSKAKRFALINTELNSGNFIIGQDNSYLIDWEKPILGDPEQDLAHFLVPTTTMWKTEKILSRKEIEGFLEAYEKYNQVDLERLGIYFKLNLLRGLSWSAMAKSQYDRDGVKNQDTAEKIDRYLKKDFLEEVLKIYKVEI